MSKILKHLKYMNYRIRYRTVKGYFKRAILKKPVLRSVELAITYDCNAGCDMCYARNLKEKKKLLTVEQIKNVWDQAYRLGAIHINVTGGEPLVRKDIYDIIKVLKPKSSIVSVVTNASLINEEVIKKLKEAGLNYLQISLDSTDPKMHNELRKIPNLYDKIINTVNLCKKYNINVCFSSVVYHEGIKEFKKIVELAKKYDIFVLMNYVGIIGGWDRAVDKALTKEDFEEIRNLMKDPNVRYHTMYNFSCRQECPAGKEKLYITAYGDVMTCVKIQQKVWGNVLNEPLKDIWMRMYNDPEFRRIEATCKRFKL